MIKIAICDDDANNNETIRSYCDRISIVKKISVSIELFNNGENLLDYYKNNQETFNIIFLDIEMGADKKNGIETAKKIREIDNKSHIIFLTNYPEYIRDSFYVQASNYLNKPLTYDDFEAEFKRIYDLMNVGQKNIYVIKTLASKDKPAEDLVLYLDDVLYFESCNNLVRKKSETIIITKDNSRKNPIKTDTPVIKIADDLKKFEFINIMRGILVNANHISGFPVNSRYINLDNGEKIMYAKGTLKKIKSEYMRIKLSRW